MTGARDDTFETGTGAYPMRIWVPDAGTGPVVLVLQEIFGVDGFVDDTCRDLAALGCTAVAPDVFWRAGPGIVLDGADPAQLATALDLGRTLDMAGAVDDIRSALDSVLAIPEATGPAAVLGFCLGGTLAFLLAAADVRVAACISYYGAGVPGAIERLATVRCPTLFHFGADDPVISRERVERVVAAAAGRTDVAVEIAAGAGHAFANPRSTAGYAPAQAAAAWASTVHVLRTALSLPTGD